MKALLIIGMQVDLGPGGGAEVPNSRDLDKAISTLMEDYELVVAAHYWMPVEHQVFAANHMWRKPGQPIEVGGEKAELKNFFCIQNSFGAEHMMGIDASKISFTAKMGATPTLLPRSAFFDSGKTQNTGLSEFLKEKNIDELHVAGMPFESIVKNTIEDAQELGFKVLVKKEYCRGFE